jgi:hypothetical protein
MRALIILTRKRRSPSGKWKKMMNVLRVTRKPRINSLVQMKIEPKEIENAELIEKIFSCWPSFHDAEIHRIVMTRNGEGGSQMDVTIHHWTMTNELNSKGFYILKDHTLTTLRFFQICDLELNGFNHQNVLWDLKITKVTDAASASAFLVAMPTSFGCDAFFKCGRIRVLSAEPYSKS